MISKFQNAQMIKVNCYQTTSKDNIDFIFLTGKKYSFMKLICQYIVEEVYSAANISKDTSKPQVNDIVTIDGLDNRRFKIIDIIK